MISIRKNFSDRNKAVIRGDIARIALLAVITTLLWCTLYNRWTAESWRTPLTYLSEPEKGDVIGFLAAVRVARDGHSSFFEFTDVPELGAPHVANWDDVPATEKPLVLMTGFLARIIGLFAAANAMVLLGHVLAAISFYIACRLLNGAWEWSLAGAMVFALSRYAFAHGLHHITVAYCWHVPLCLVVCEWLIRGEGIKPGERRFWFALIVAFVAGVQNVYYTYLFAQFVLFGGLYQGWRAGWGRLLPAAAIVGTSALAFLLMNLTSIFYHLVNGDNQGAVVRDYHWMEIYGLKLVDLVIPPPDHVFPPFAAWGAHHVSEVLLAPGESPPTAYLGLLDPFCRWRRS
jgi:phosphoglycerol transferase